MHAEVHQALRPHLLLKCILDQNSEGHSSEGVPYPSVALSAQLQLQLQSQSQDASTGLLDIWST